MVLKRENRSEPPSPLCFFHFWFRRKHPSCGKPASSCSTSAAAPPLHTSSDATTSTVRREVSGLLSRQRCRHSLHMLTLSLSCSLHAVRRLRVPGGVLQHGLPHDGLLGLRERSGDGRHAAGGQAVLTGTGPVLTQRTRADQSVPQGRNQKFRWNCRTRWWEH